MKFLLHKNLIALAVAFATMPFWNILSPVFSSATTTNQASRWARFELNEQDSTGDLQTGKPLTLAITLGGVAPGPIPIVALCESILFEPQTVTLEPDADSSTLKGSDSGTDAVEPDVRSSKGCAYPGDICPIQAGQIRAIHEADRVRDVGTTGTLQRFRRAIQRASRGTIQQ